MASSSAPPGPALLPRPDAAGIARAASPGPALVRNSDAHSEKAAHKAREDDDRASVPPAMSTTAASPPSVNLLAMTKVERLQTYLPTGTWVAFTALQTLAFSLSAGVPPSGARNCNDSQRIALTVFAALAALFALAQPFLKTFLRDASGRHIVYPPPSGVAVADTVDAGVVFPYRTERRHVVWPAVRAAPDGRLALVRDGQYIKVLVLDKSCTFRVRTQSRFSRILARILPPVNPIKLIARESDTPDPTPAPPPSPPAEEGSIEGALQKKLHRLEPVWRGALPGPGTQYLDLSLQALLHALVSVSAFLALALLSTQVAGCLYPGLTDWVPVVAQVATLVLISGVACFFVDDRAASPTQQQPTTGAPQSTSTSPQLSKTESSAAPDDGSDAVSIEIQLDPDVPPLLAHLVSDVLWVRAERIDPPKPA